MDCDPHLAMAIVAWVSWVAGMMFGIWLIEDSEVHPDDRV